MRTLLKWVSLALLTFVMFGMVTLVLFTEDQLHPTQDDLAECTATVLSVEVSSTEQRTYISIHTGSPAYLLSIPPEISRVVGKAPFEALHEGETLIFHLDRRAIGTPNKAGEQVIRPLSLRSEGNVMYTLEDSLPLLAEAAAPALLTGRIVALIATGLLIALMAVSAYRKRRH